MALGKGFSAFCPKSNETAASLLGASTKAEHKKEVTIQLRIEEDKALLFKEICQKRCPDDKRGAMSAALRNFINNAIATDGTILSFKE